MAVLVGFEAKGIQSWIISGGKLKDIAGGSDLIEAIRDDVRKSVMTACGFTEAEPNGTVTILAAGAGAFRLLVADDALAQRMVRLLPVMIAEWAPGLRYGLACLRLDGDQPTPGEFEAFQTALRDDGGLPGPLLPPATPLMLRAQRTGEPAVDEKPRDDDGVQGTEAVDASMRRRRRAEAAEGKASVFKTRLFPCMAGDFTKDVDVIVDEGAYMALLHADGNGLGQLFMDIGRADMDPPIRTALMRALSDAVDRATGTAVRQALCTVFSDIETRQGAIPVRPIVLGGDDVTILLPAREAIRFTQSFLAAFGTETARELAPLKDRYAAMPDRLTACAGVAFVKPHYPFDQAHTLAESLCKFAKKRSRRAGHTLCSLAFHRVTTTLARDFKDDIIRHDLTLTVNKTKSRLLTMAPYRVPEGDGGVPDEGDRNGQPLALLEHLLRLEDVVDRLPRGSWRELAGLVRENDVLADARYHRLVELLPKKPADTDGTDRPQATADDLTRALQSLGCAPPRLWTPETGAEEAPVRTPMLDVTALLAATGRGRNSGVEAKGEAEG